MKYLVLFILSLLSPWQFMLAQAPDFYSDIAPIVHQNCTPCHRPGGEGPFKLITYEDVAKRAEFIGQVTQTRYMPPWLAEEGFGDFRNERRLSVNEINTIREWINGGLKRGDKYDYKEPDWPQAQDPSLKPDLELSLSAPFVIPGDNSEQYIFFNVPTNLEKDGYISSIEFIPGNKKLVHHSRIMSDTSNLIRGIDGLSETHPGVKEFMKIPLFDQFLYGWVPGNSKFFFPPGTGKKIHQETDFIVNIHYAPSPVPETDLSRINVYLAKEKVTREVKTITITENFITNQPFRVPAGEVKTFYSRTPPLKTDLSLIAILPHMHLLGKAFRAYAITPDGDVIKLIKINEWNFNWQNTYQFRKLVKVPRNSVIYVEATYDNTAENPVNPNDPPVDVTYGWNTTDEMMNFIIFCLEYQEGDEHWEY